MDGGVIREFPVDAGPEAELGRPDPAVPEVHPADDPAGPRDHRELGLLCFFWAPDVRQGVTVLRSLFRDMQRSLGHEAHPITLRARDPPGDEGAPVMYRLDLVLEGLVETPLAGEHARQRSHGLVRCRGGRQHHRLGEQLAAEHAGCGNSQGLSKGGDAAP